MRLKEHQWRCQRERLMKTECSRVDQLCEWKTEYRLTYIRELDRKGVWARSLMSAACSLFYMHQLVYIPELLVQISSALTYKLRHLQNKLHGGIWDRSCSLQPMNTLDWKFITLAVMAMLIRAESNMTSYLMNERSLCLRRLCGRNPFSFI